MKKLGELLREAGVLDDAGLQRALTRQKQTGQRLGEALIELRIISEDQLFDTLARQLSIPIIAEPKLLMVEVTKPVIAMLEPAVAWAHYALPLLVDPAKTQLAIVTAEPSDPSTVAAVRRATGVNTVKTYLAKRSAMRKVLEKYYGPPPASGSADQGIGELLLEDTSEAEVAPAPPPQPPRTAERVSRPGPAVAAPAAKPQPQSIGRIDIAKAAPPPAVNSFAQEEPSQSIRAKVAAKQRVIKRVIVADNNKSVAGGVKRSLEMEGFTVEIATSEAEILNLVKTKGFDLVVAKGAIAENIGELERRVRSVFPLIEFRVVPSFATALMGDPVPYTRLTDFTFDAFDLFLSLLERGDAKARARAQTNARYAKMIAQRLQLPRKSIDEVYYAAYLDAVGDVLVRQRGGDPGDRAMARKLSLELFRNVNPPYDAETLLLAAEERVDGSGPRGMKGDQIPIGARILAVVFGYHDAKGIPRDQLQKFMRDMAGRTFDNRIVETFLQILRQEALLGESGGVAAQAGTILIVDKDVAHTSTLELRLGNEGYRVAVCGDGQAALELARQDPPILILSEIALPRMDGFNLCMEIKSDARTQAVPFVFVSGKNDEFNSNKAMDLGADDFIGKPVNVEFLLKKLKSFLVKPKAATSSGSSSGGRLSDFGIVELIQTLSLGMKTVKLELRHDTRGRGVLYLENGRIVHAGTEDKAGEEAFYQIATWADGSFEIHSNQTATDKNVAVSNDFLILEALRRMDEAEAGISQDGKEASVTGPRKA